MLLPGDVIVGISEKENDDRYFFGTSFKSELQSHFGRLQRRINNDGKIWVTIKREGNKLVKLRAFMVSYRSSRFLRRYTIRTASNDRQFAVLGDLNLDQCSELQEMSRKVVSLDTRGFNRKGVKYEWKEKVNTYLPDPRSTVISSILFMPLADEQNVDATTARSMAWFSAAVSSGAPLVFVNIQTEQIVNYDKYRPYYGKQRNYNPIETITAIRLWFLPGVAEVLIVLKPEPGETRVGIDIRRTEEGFVCINSVTTGSAAYRAGIERLEKEASETGNLVVISRIEGKSVLTSTVSSTDAGLVHCCDIAELKATIAAVLDEVDEINLHVMGWPSSKSHSNIAVAPPTISNTVSTLMTTTNSI
ncbi:uncharacterized protein LOC113293904 [Papaver somniferum]|uniref:uncharacterized protein LOC113293904 n=1 Tax=Papaver somniferum TaxID=3469 RepID=UPI000E6FEFF6|nr:uncharacterized protein LOC113293904 [Papaver somniferum]